MIQKLTLKTDDAYDEDININKKTNVMDHEDMNMNKKTNDKDDYTNYNIGKQRLT